MIWGPSLCQEGYLLYQLLLLGYYTVIVSGGISSGSNYFMGDLSLFLEGHCCVRYDQGPVIVSGGVQIIFLHMY